MVLRPYTESITQLEARTPLATPRTQTIPSMGPPTTPAEYLFLSKEPKTSCERPVLRTAKGQEVRRIDIAIDYIGIMPVGNVVEPGPHCEVVIQEPEPALEMNIK